MARKYLSNLKTYTRNIRPTPSEYEAITSVFEMCDKLNDMEFFTTGTELKTITDSIVSSKDDEASGNLKKTW